MAINMGSLVRVNLFDGHLKDGEGCVIGIGKNSKEEQVYLVEMKAAKSDHPEKAVGHAQIAAGKPWVLSVYAQELKEAKGAVHA